MLIPKIGDWINCFDKEAPGKVLKIDIERRKCTADFFTEWTCQEDVGGTAEGIVSFSEIKEIINDLEMINSFEKELAGEVSFED